MAEKNSPVRLKGEKTIRAEQAGAGYEQLQLENGLTVLIAPMPGQRAAQAALGVNFGSVDQRFLWQGQLHRLPAGVAHFLEHKMFESETGDAFDLYAETGASANAYTGFERTCYVFSATERVDESLDILLGQLFHPWFTAETVAKEQGIIGQEIKMYEDSPDWRVLFALFGCLYHNCGLKEDIAGTVDSIARITPEMLYTCTDAFYTPGNMALAVAGNITRQQVLQALARAGLPAGGPVGEKQPLPEPDTICSGGCTLSMQVSQPVVALGFKELPPPAGERVRWEVMADLLGELIAGETSPLYRRLYDAGLINGGFGAEVYSGPGYFSILFSGESRDPLAVRDALLQEIERLRQGGIEEEAFLLCRNLLYGEAVADLENAETVAGELAACGLRGDTLFDSLQQLGRLTLPQLQQALGRLLRADHSATVVLQPAGQKGGAGQ